MPSDIVKAESVMKIGQRLAFFGSEGESYKSRIEDITPTALVVDMPVDSKRRPVIPQPGEHLYGAVYENQCQYRFFCVFKKKGLQNSIPCWWITKPEQAERHQNREFVRVRVDLPIQVQVMDENGGFRQPQMTRTLDLSGNGLAFVLDRSVKTDSQVIMELRNLPEIGTLRIMGRVVRCTRVELADGDYIFQIGIRMMDLTRPIRNRLVHYIFEIQRKELAKGLDIAGVTK